MLLPNQLNRDEYALVMDVRWAALDKFTDWDISSNNIEHFRNFIGLELTESPMKDYWTKRQTERCKLICGPHGYAIYKAWKANQSE